MALHLLDLIGDEHGILPTVMAVGDDGERDRRTYKQWGWDLPLQEEPIPLEQTSLQQGPLRHADVVAWSGDGSPIGPSIVVSDRLHQLLQLASLPSHRVHHAVVKWPAKRHSQHGTGETPHWLYVFPRSVTLESWDLAKTSITTTVRLRSKREKYARVHAPGTFETVAEIMDTARENCSEEENPWALPTAFDGPVDKNYDVVVDYGHPEFPLPMSDLDLFFLPDGHMPWVSSALRGAIEALDAVGVTISETWDADRVTMQPAAPDQPEAMTTQAMSLAGPLRRDPLFEQQLERRTLVLSRRDRVREMRSASDPVGAIEDRLDVLFPAGYRQALDANTLPERRRFRYVSGDELVTLEEIDPGWSELARPDAVRALLVAIDDHGDYLGLLLEEDSLVQLSPELWHFHHETGEISRHDEPAPF